MGAGAIMSLRTSSSVRACAAVSWKPSASRPAAIASWFAMHAPSASSTSCAGALPAAIARPTPWISLDSSSLGGRTPARFFGSFLMQRKRPRTGCRRTFAGAALNAPRECGAPGMRGKTCPAWQNMSSTGKACPARPHMGAPPMHAGAPACGVARACARKSVCPDAPEELATQQEPELQEEELVKGKPLAAALGVLQRSGRVDRLQRLLGGALIRQAGRRTGNQRAPATQASALRAAPPGHVRT
jgi:hypothetical protein